MLNERAFKIALSYIKCSTPPPFEESPALKSNDLVLKLKTNIFLKMLKDIKHFKKLPERVFYTMLKENNIDAKYLNGILSKVFHSKNVDDITLLASTLGEFSDNRISNIYSKEFISKSFDDAHLEGVIPEDNWPLFKDNNWISKKKSVKNILETIKKPVVIPGRRNLKEKV